MEERRKASSPAGTIHRTIALLHDALRALHAQMPLPEVERVAVMINQAMTAGARSFHTPEHVFDLVHPGRPTARSPPCSTTSCTTRWTRASCRR